MIRLKKKNNFKVILVSLTTLNSLKFWCEVDEKNGRMIRSIIWGGPKLHRANFFENPSEKCSSEIQKN